MVHGYVIFQRLGERELFLMSSAGTTFVKSPILAVSIADLLHFHVYLFPQLLRFLHALPDTRHLLLGEFYLLLGSLRFAL